MAISVENPKYLPAIAIVRDNRTISYDSRVITLSGDRWEYVQVLAQRAGNFCTLEEIAEAIEAHPSKKNIAKAIRKVKNRFGEKLGNSELIEEKWPSFRLAALVEFKPAPVITRRQIVETPQAQSEKELIEKAKINPEAIADIYSSYYKQIRSFIYSMVGHRPTSEDLAQDVFVKVIRGIKEYRYTGISLSNWLFRIAHNTAVDYLRKTGRVRFLSVDTEVDYEDQGVQTEEELEQKLDHITKREVLQKLYPYLTSEERLAIDLIYGKGLTNKEVREKTGMTQSTIKNTLSRAREKLRGKLNPEMFDWL